MKFVTVMDMWLLIINIFMIGGLFYFGRRLLKTITRLVNVGEAREESAERRRCIAIIEEEIEQHRTWDSMHIDNDAKMITSVLEDVITRIKDRPKK